MADLRGKEIKDEYANLLTKGPNGEVQDGEGNDLSLRTNTNILGNLEKSVPDDNFISVDVPFNRNLLVLINVHAGSNLSSAVIAARTGTTLLSEILMQGTPSMIEADTGTPTGTTGTDGKVTVFVDEGQVHVENRFGSGRIISLLIIN